jgi:hypothetical protein
MLALFERSAADIDMNSFLLHSWLSQYEFTSEKKLFRKIKDHVRSNNVNNYLDSLCSEAVIYRQILEPLVGERTREEQDLRSALEALVLFRVKQQLPMTLAVMRDYKARRLSLKNAKWILKCVENFHFVFTAVTSQRSSGGISQMYAAAARSLVEARDEDGKIASLREFAQKLRERRPSYDEFLIYFHEIVFVSSFTKQRGLVRYALRKFGENASGEACLDYSKMTIEHIEPQLGDDIGLGQASWIGRFGNLILVPGSLNERLRNREFAAKRGILAEEDVPMEEVLRNAVSWGKEEVHARTTDMAKTAYHEIWNF